jgi:protein SCO1/2
MMNMSLKSLKAALLGSLILGLAACHRQPAPAPTPAASAPAASATNTYLVNGTLRKITPEEKTVTIQHEEIKGYMEAMTMPFTLRNTNELAGLEVGNTVVFRLNVTENDSWIDKLKKAPTPAQLEEPPKREPVRVVRDVPELKIGDFIPDYRFTNELGQPVSLGELKGRAVALTFIYTRCPIPNFCPLMTKNFSQVYKQLSTGADLPTNWHLLTLSFDPHHDTPATLKSYAERQEYDPKKWSFVTGAMIDIDAITDQFNLGIAVQNDQWDHKLRSAVIDAAGRVQKIIIGNQWKPEELVAEIVKAAAAK